MDAANFLDTFGRDRIIERATIDTCRDIFQPEVTADALVRVTRIRERGEGRESIEISRIASLNERIISILM